MGKICACFKIEEFAGPGMPLYRVLLTLDGRVLRYRRQFKDRHEAQEVVRRWKKMFRADPAFLDLRADWRPVVK